MSLPVHPAQWAELVTTALLGTDRRSADDAGDHDPAAALLRQAARHRVLALLDTQGPPDDHDDQVAPDVSAPGVAPPQDRPAAPPAADRLLADLLRTPDPALVSCWLGACAEHGRTVHPVHWTRLARLAARTGAYDRRLLGEALGPQGRWFLRQNPEWRRLAADVERPTEIPETPRTPPINPTGQDVLRDPEAIFAAARPWHPELVAAAYAVLGGAGDAPPPRGYATRLGVALPAELYPSIAKAGEYYLLDPDASPGRRRTVRDRFVALELAAYARAAIVHAFDGHPDDTGFSRAEIPHV